MCIHISLKTVRDGTVVGAKGVKLWDILAGYCGFILNNSLSLFDSYEIHYDVWVSTLSTWLLPLGRGRDHWFEILWVSMCLYV